MSDVDLTARMLHLRQIPVATMVGQPVLRELAASMEERTLAPGERALVQGEPVDGMFLLTEGGIDLVRDGKPFGALVAPQTVGFLPILARTPAPYDVVARTEVRALELSTETLVDLLADHFELLAATLRYLAERLWFEFQELPAAALGLPAVDLGPVPPTQIDLVRRILIFQKVSGFASASVNTLAVLSRQVEEVRLPAGARIWRTGDRADHVLFLVAGTIACATPDGRTFRYGTGTGVGGVESLAERPRWYEATAETDIVAFRGHGEDLLDLFEHQLRMAMDFLAMLAGGQLAILAKKAATGQDPLRAVRAVEKLGAIRYGA